MKDNRINYDLERKLRRYAIGNLMKYIVIGQGIVFALMYIWPTLGYRLYSLISLTRAGLMRGQIWRLVTFVFTPPSSSPIFILFALYFYYMIGLGLENQWGKVRFNLYYAVGMLGSIIAATVLTILPEALRQFADYRMLVYAIVLILVMLTTNNPTIKGFLGRLVSGIKKPKQTASAGEEESK